ncbi:SUKH-4 family immunity protein [Streptomyces sp. NBC_00659]|uniref:SUKH-4 family immunity protein n=1 Tax=Streptomyces sp. NBC_00659 TaxID=2903669 RepID=UPI002E31051E|nr:SUKH-4 family immunity protein [Streptomyces sp. NBC_00659]
MTREDLDTLFADPAALLAAEPEALRDLPGTGGGAGREAYAQAVAILDRAEVPRAEFASWLHFGAKILGHDAYADLVAEAEPDMPWRTVWAWWRPVGAYRAKPNLSGDADVEVHEAPDGRLLLKVWSLWTREHWIDPATGRRVPAPADGEFGERPYDAPVEGPVLFDPDDDHGLYQPDAWEEPAPLGDDRVMFFDPRGVVVLERNGAAADGPTGSEAVSRGQGDPWFAGPAAAEAPLDAARLEEAFGPDGLALLTRDQLPAALKHAPTRELAATAGLPTWFVAGVATFTLAWNDGKAHGLEPDENGLLHLGTFELAYADTGRVLVHPETGAVSMVRNGQGPFPFARDTETFVRLLEAVYRFMGACWNPYPGECGERDFLAEVAALEPLTVNEEAPAQNVWEHLFAAIVELSAWGF